MLQYLAVHNFALVDRLEVELGRGLNLLTGETGSGKSIFVNALAQLIGARASLELVRTGADSATVEGLFSLDSTHPVLRILEKEEIPREGNDIIVRRVISSSGSKVFINNALTTQGLLARLGRRLADIHGQHDQQDCLRPRYHLDVLDVFAGNRKRRAAVGKRYRELARNRRDLESLSSSEAQRERETEDIRFQLKELKKLGLQSGLEDSLRAEQQRLASAEGRARASQKAYEILYDREHSVLSLLGQAEQNLGELTRLDADQEKLLRQVAEARILLSEASYELRDYAHDISFNQERLDLLEERLSRLRRAQRRYGKDTEELIAHLRSLEERLETLSNHESRLARLQAQESESRREFEQEASQLSERRRSAAPRLEQRVERELAELAMEGSRFQISIEQRDAGASGFDHVEFLLSANPGEPPRPMSKIASGGELSRIVLALKSIANVDRFSKTLVFDEIDAGIGGRTASAVGDKLQKVAEDHQVVCVTHLPQIAARASHHFHVGKVQSDQRTLIRIARLTGIERRRELARMLAGAEVTETTLAQAQELLERSETTPDPTMS